MSSGTGSDPLGYGEDLVEKLNIMASWPLERRVVKPDANGDSGLQCS